MIVCSLLCIWVCNLWMMVRMTKILCQAWGNQTLAVHPTWLFFTYARYALVCYHLCWGDDFLVFTFIKLKGLFLTKLYLQFCLMAALGIEMLTFPLLNLTLVSRSNFSTLAYFWQSEDHLSFWRSVHRHLVSFCVKLDDNFLQVGCCAVSYNSVDSNTRHGIGDSGREQKWATHSTKASSKIEQTLQREGMGFKSREWQGSCSIVFRAYTCNCSLWFLGLPW